jgi:hypothetical protein
MANETNQDPQNPTQDQPPPKQYATPRPGQSGERGTDERKPKNLDHIQSSEGDDEDQGSAAQKPGYDEDASTKGATGHGSADKQSHSSGQQDRSSGTSKPGGGTGQSSGSGGSGQSSGSGSRQTPGSGGAGGSSGSSNPQSDKGSGKR